jgi:hypothetical protein
VIRGILLISGLVAVLLGVFYVSGLPAEDLDIISNGGLLPRAVSWVCLLLGVYGLARRRFSPFLMLLFFTCAFFFTYIAPFIIKGLY